MTNRIFLSIATAVIALSACSREDDRPGSTENGNSIVITAGFEEQAPASRTPDTKTYLSGDGTRISWSSDSRDKRIYVFDSKGGKNTFTSSSTSPEAVRSFSGSITAGSEIKYVLWHGYTDNTVLTENAGGVGTESVTPGGSATWETKADLVPPATVFSGSCLTLPSIQEITNQNSFERYSNFSVMKEGDTCLKSVFGYLRYRIPLSRIDNNATIRRIKITADEDIAGQVEIDYTGADPVAKIVSGGSKSITVNTRWQPNAPQRYEPGLYFAIIPAGTYHNMEIEITAFSGGASTQDAPTNEPFTIYCRGDVLVERGKYTDLGTLPVSKTARTNPDEPLDHNSTEYYDYLFDTDFFEKYTDDSGAVSYRIKSESIGWDYSQSGYYVTHGMTDDERFIVFMVQANEFRPSYHVLQKHERSAKVLDLQTRKLYTFYATDGCYPYLDPVNDVLYYCILSDDRTSARFYKRELLTAPDTEVPLAYFPSQLIPEGVSSPIKRVCSHLTLTQDRRKVFLDARVVDTFYQGLLDLYTGEWTEWSHNENALNLTHGQLNPVRDDEALIDVDEWTDSNGVEHKMQDAGVGYDDDGAFGGTGSYRRMQIIRSDGSLTTVKPAPSSNYATHDGWHPDGMHIYWCAGIKEGRGGVPADGGFHIRRVHDSTMDTEIREGAVSSVPVIRATHCNFSQDKKYVVHDDDSKYRIGLSPYVDYNEYSPASNYTDAYYRGGPWRVWFYNLETGRDILIYTDLAPITDISHPSRIHPDPHPHFVANDKYIVCTASGSDGNLHWSITPVDQLITLSQ